MQIFRRREKEEEDLFTPVKVPGPLKYLAWLWAALIGWSAGWAVWGLLHREWWDAAFHLALIVLNAVIWRASYVSRERHRRAMQGHADRIEDIRSSVLNRYYLHALTVGERRAYLDTAEIFSDRSLKSLGIYKTPEELEELR